ncbi:FtsW/RodA/SpoVE family cell cycle protein, partial [Rhizobium johnstonii]
ATVLSGLGLAMISRLDLADELSGWGAFSTRQLIWLVISIMGATAVVLFLENYRVLFRYTYVFGFVGIALLLLPLVPGLGVEAGADV